jgi:hypothetical protein
VVPPGGAPAEPSTIELKFLETGAAYQRAKVVADRLGLSVRDYLVHCIAEGHFVLSVRTTQIDELDRPSFERHRSIQTDFDVEAALRKLRDTFIRRRDR